MLLVTYKRCNCFVPHTWSMLLSINVLLYKGPAATYDPLQFIKKCKQLNGHLVFFNSAFQQHIKMALIRIRSNVHTECTVHSALYLTASFPIQCAESEQLKVAFGWINVKMCTQCTACSTTVWTGNSGHSNGVRWRSYYLTWLFDFKIKAFCSTFTKTKIIEKYIYLSSCLSIVS